VTIERLTQRDRAGHRAPSGALPRLARILAASAFFLAVVFVFQGCGGDHDAPPELTKEAVKFDDVPENVRAAASKAIPGVKFSEAWKNVGRERELHSYEIRGKNAADGKTREVRVSLTGEILETE
jgi:hypothetical protein